MIGRVVAICIFIFLLLFAYLLSSIVDWVDFIAAFFIFIFIYLYFKNYEINFFLNIQFVIGWIWAVVSVFYIQTGAYISEQFIYGREIGSISRLGIYIFTFLLVQNIIPIGSSIKDFSTSISIGRRKSFLGYVAALNFMVCIPFILSYYLKGLPLIIGESRFEYWVGIEGLRSFVYIVPVISFFNGIGYTLCWKKIYIRLSVALAIILFIFGEKFTGPFLVAIYFSMGYFLSSSAFGIKINYNGVLRVGILIFILLIAMVSVGYILLHDKSSDQLIDVIINRALALQGHVWYGISLIDKKFDINSAYINFFKNGDVIGESGGLEMLMYAISPADFVTGMREAGIRFTGGFPAIFYYIFGFWGGLLFVMIAGFLYSLFGRLLFESIKKMDFVIIFLLLMFYNNIIGNVLIMGELFYLWSLKSIILMLAIVFVKLIRRV